MSLARIRKPTLIVLSLLLALAVLSFAPQPAAPASGSSAIALKAPSFISVANAQEGTSAQEEPATAPMGFPQDEAGIAAYFKSASPVTLASVRSIYRAIEAETADYIIGSVQVPNYPESYDVHLYVHRAGWFMAYYLAANPTAKIVDWVGYNKNAIPSGGSIPTVFETVLRLASISAGVAFSGSTYYDFRYPNATNLMLVAEDTWNGKELQVKLPISYAYYETSWSLYASKCSNPALYLDNVRIGYAPTCGWGFVSGALTPAQMLPDTYHAMEVAADTGYGGLSFTYRVQ